MMENRKSALSAGAGYFSCWKGSQPASIQVPAPLPVEGSEALGPSAS